MTQEPDGSVVVHNHPQPLAKRMPATVRTVELPPQGATKAEVKNAAKRAAKKAAPPPVQEAAKPAKKATARGKKTAKAAAAPAFSEPSVPAPLVAAPAPPPVPVQREPMWKELPGSGEERDPAKLAGNVYRLSQVCAEGLPPEYPVRFHDEVLSLSFVDLEEAEQAIRHPERVVIAEQTAEKGYPILRFHNGSVIVVVGFRSRSEPSIIAVYYSETIMRNGNGAGGGGSKKEKGVPKTVGQLVKALRELGVTFDTEEEHPEVRLGETSLGKITLGRVRHRDDVESDWQRIQRKVDAIRRRGE